MVSVTEMAVLVYQPLVVKVAVVRHLQVVQVVQVEVAFQAVVVVIHLALALAHKLAVLVVQV
jgi:hypothetical protein